MTNSTRSCLVLLASAAAVSCSAGSGHAECRDAISTQNYGLKWQEDLATARQADKLTVDQVVDAQGSMYEKLSLLKEKKWTEYCTHLDQLRQETGF